MLQAAAGWQDAARIETMSSRTAVLLEILIDRRGRPAIFGGLPPM
jgi:hypothetical protein